MKKDIEVLNKAYRVVDMGIIGIVEVVEKVDDSCLEKLMLDQKKEYQVIKSDIKKVLDNYEEDPKKIGTITRVSNDVYTNVKLMMNENDSEIAKMMLEGTNRGIIEVKKILNEKDYNNDSITPIMDKLLEILEYNEKELKKYL